jgi:hypothetical protein
MIVDGDKVRIAPPSPHNNKPAMLLASNIATDPDYSTKEDPFYEPPPPPPQKEEKVSPRFSVHGGIVTVFGVASWNPAVGGVVGVGLRVNQYLSFGLEGRAAWSTMQVASQPTLSAMTVGGLLSACGHFRWLVGCGLGYFGTVNVEAAEKIFIADTLVFAEPGVGGRLGVELPIGASFVARASFDALRLANPTVIVFGYRTSVDQPPIMLGGQLTGEWKF